MKNIKYIISATVASVALMLSVALPKVVGDDPLIDNEIKVTICHRTNSVKNPYVKITVDASAVDGQSNNDHSHHIGPVATSEAVAQALKDSKTKWGDIIPPVPGVTTGLNWDSGQEVLKNGCLGLGGENIVEVVPAAVTFTAPTCDALGSYTIPTTENVQYLINGKVVAAGTYTAQNGTTVTVTAETTQEGFFIGDETTDTWTNAFTAPTNCGEVLGATTTTPPQVTAKPVGGVSAGAGGGSSTSTAAMVGLVGSIVTLGLGLSVRKWTT